MEDFQLKLEDLRARMNLSEEEMEERAKDLRAWYLRSEDLAEYYPEEFEKVGNEEALNEKLAMPVLERANSTTSRLTSIHIYPIHSKVVLRILHLKVHRND